MKKYYIVVDTCINGKCLSIADSFSECENLVHLVKRYVGTVAIEIMPTKKHAEEVERVRNDIYKADGRLYDFKD